ncbi:MAG: hypothetical protein R3B48_26755 [Kofleriaceae bacterium]
MTGTRARRSAKAKLIEAPAEKELLAALRRAGSSDEVRELVRDAFPSEVELDVALWDLAVRGKLPLANLAVVDAFTDFGAPSPEALVTMWTKAKAAWFTHHPVQIPGVPDLLFSLTSTAAGTDPAPWRAAAPELAEPLRAAVWLAVVEHARDTVPEDIVAELRGRILADPFGSGMCMVLENLRILGLDDAAIAEGLLSRLPPQNRPRIQDLEPLFMVAKLADLEAAMCAEEASNYHNKTYAKVLRARRDSMAELIILAKTVRDRMAPDRSAISDSPVSLHPGHGLVQVILDVALERAAAAGEEVPAEVDAMLTFCWEEPSYVSPALAALPKDRLEAAIRRVLTRRAQRGQRQRVFPAVRYTFNDSLMAAVVAEARSACMETLSRLNLEPTSLGMIGPAALPALEAALDAALKDTTYKARYHRDRWLTQLRRAITVALGEGAREGKAIDPRFDALLGPHRECLDSDIFAEVFAGRRNFGGLLARLPEARARAIIQEWLEADRNDRLGVREALERELSEGHQHLLGPAEPLMERLRRMVAETGLPATTRVYVLEPTAELDPSSLNRICAEPVGLPDERWPRHRGKRMEHVFTLDLTQVPELRELCGLNEDARGLVLLVSSRDSNRAYSPGTKETELVALTEAELTAGHGEDGGSFLIHPLDVPSGAFRDKQRDALGELAVALRQLPAIALAPPYWIQEDEHAGPLLLQFTSFFAPMNLGDNGRMYVFPDAAFWQCY